GIAEVERGCGFGKAADAGAFDRPGPFADTVDAGAERLQGLGGVEDVFTSSRPETKVSPTVSAPKMRARIEIDLSPGTRTRPAKGPLRRAIKGTWAGSECMFGVQPGGNTHSVTAVYHGAARRVIPGSPPVVFPGPTAGDRRQSTIDSRVSTS